MRVLYLREEYSINILKMFEEISNENKDFEIILNNTTLYFETKNLSAYHFNVMYNANYSKEFRGNFKGDFKVSFLSTNRLDEIEILYNMIGRIIGKFTFF